MLLQASLVAMVAAFGYPHTGELKEHAATVLYNDVLPWNIGWPGSVHRKSNGFVEGIDRTAPKQFFPPFLAKYFMHLWEQLEHHVGGWPFIPTS